MAGAVTLASIMAVTTAGADDNTFIVTTLADETGSCTSESCSLRQAVGAANQIQQATEIIFDSELSGTLELEHGSINFNNGRTTITGPGSDRVTIDAGGQSRIFNVTFGQGVSRLTLSGLRLVNGDAGDGNGGAVRFSYLLELDDVVIENSTAAWGGAVASFSTYYGSSTLEMKSSVARNNSADFAGALHSIQVFIEDSLIAGNYARGSRGGVSTSFADIRNSTISGNHAEFDLDVFSNDFFFRSEWETGGGGVRANAAVLKNSTISGNYSRLWGGGIGVVRSLTATNSTIVNNSANSINGGGINTYNSTQSQYRIELNNTIVANNTAANEDRSDLRATFVTIDYSLIGIVEDDLEEALEDRGNLWGSAEEPLDPLLQPLADNGGLTPTHALGSNSPAFNAGDPDFEGPPFQDQRGLGFHRIGFGRIDIGAYEFQQDVLFHDRFIDSDEDP